jgi:hypothetical protein
MFGKERTATTFGSSSTLAADRVHPGVTVIAFHVAPAPSVAVTVWIKLLTPGPVICLTSADCKHVAVLIIPPNSFYGA